MLAIFLAAAVSTQPISKCDPTPIDSRDTRLAFIGDSGYGTGSAAWGNDDQRAVARQIAKLRHCPDRVYFLGDNIYWKGNKERFRERFDEPYEAILKKSSVRVALGNHDVKGCRTAPARTVPPDQLGEEWKAWVKSVLPDEAERTLAEGWVERDLSNKEDARVVEGVTPFAVTSILSPWQTAYEDGGQAGSCNAHYALAHQTFAFPFLKDCVGRSGSPDDPCLMFYRRYHSDVVGQAETLLLDSNTLAVDGGLLDPKRWDTLQMLWLAAKLSPLPGDARWKFVGLHHPPYTPTGCVITIPSCRGGHGDEVRLQRQLEWMAALPGRTNESDEKRATAPTELTPDAYMTAHNHFYSRTRPLGRGGVPVVGNPLPEAGAPPRDRGVRYFLSGGGGAPLYEIKEPWSERIANAQKIHHFLWVRLTHDAAFYWALDSKLRPREWGCFHHGSDQDHPSAEDSKDVVDPAKKEEIKNFLKEKFDADVTALECHQDSVVVQPEEKK
jgi:hypothetical protein